MTNSGKLLKYYTLIIAEMLDVLTVWQTIKDATVD